MKLFFLKPAILAIPFIFGSLLKAEVPQLISYQGRIAVNGDNFQGNGQFKFALVDAGGTQTYWSNDGLSVNGSEPTNSVTLNVSNGLYSVLLGDSTLANMTPIPIDVFENNNVSVRVWFNDGSNGTELLKPDQRVAAVGYAMIANEAQSVKDGAITSSKIAAGAVTADGIATGAVTADGIATGAVTADGIATGAVTSDKLASGALTGGFAAEGSVIITSEQRTDLIADGFIQLGSLKELEPWSATSLTNAPGARTNHSAIWTGSEMIVLGGRGSNSINLGSRYNPETDTWSTISSLNAVSSPVPNSAVWTGSEMIVWNGSNGAIYNPITDSWSLISNVNQPSLREEYTTIWTGSEMIVWGGSYNAQRNFYSTGARYNPSTDTWTATSTVGAPSPRRRHTAIWTGSKMIIWGGQQGNTGAQYDPATDTWTSMSSTNVPEPRENHTAIWTGSEMIIWGGKTSSVYGYSSGGRYDPATDTWTATSLTNVPRGRTNHTSIWTGTEMIVWGGYSSSPANLETIGARYDPITDSWTSITQSNQAATRSSPTSIWTGSEMIVWGGNPISPQQTNSGGRYRVTEPVYFYVKP